MPFLRSDAMVIVHALAGESVILLLYDFFIEEARVTV